MAGAGDRTARLRAVVATIALAWFSISAVLAQELPTLTRPVTDLAGVVDTASEAQMERMIIALERATGDTVVVLAVKSVAPFADVREYAVKQFENNGRGIGHAGSDNGILVVLAMEQRRVQVEVGYGLEGIVTDGFAGETSRLVMAPEFREGRYGRGLMLGVARIIGRIAEAKHITLSDLPRPEPRAAARRSGPSTEVIIAIVVIILLAQLLGGRGRRGRNVHWGGGPWSGWGGGGFGGGGFGGGFGGGGGGGGFGGFGGGRSGGGGGGAGW